MSSRIRAHIRSNVVGYVALFFVFAGGAYALPGTNTVDSGDIQNGQVRSADVGTGQVATSDLANGSVNGAKVANNSLGSGDIGNWKVRGADLATGSVNSAKVVNGSLNSTDLADNGSLGTLEIGEGLLNVGGDLTGTVANAQIGLDAVGAAEIANGAIGTGEIDTTAVQRRVDQPCAADSSIRTIAADGTVSCEQDAGAVLTDLSFHVAESCAGDTQKFAVVAANGTLVRGEHTSSATRLAAGTYVVTFDASVTGCAHTATVGQTGSVGTSGPGLVTVAGRSGNANAIFVTTFEVQAPSDP